MDIGWALVFKTWSNGFDPRIVIELSTYDIMI